MRLNVESRDYCQETGFGVCENGYWMYNVDGMLSDGESEGERSV